MVRRIVNRMFSEDEVYSEMYGLSTDAKPTEDLITGSRFTEVDTGNVFLFNEEAGEWKQIR
jgi:hypothetical protein